MAIRYAIEIYCDGPREGGPCPDSRAWTDYHTAAELRSRMREDGWKTGLAGGVDRCPDCQERQ